MTKTKTVHDVTYDLLRTLGLTTVFGNPGSTEQTFLQNFPDDFTYILGLQEASVLAMADGFAQSTGKPALVNLHTAAGTGNAMGSLVAAYRANTPLIVTAGQQTREMSVVEPYLNNPDETVMPQPWVKWAYQPARAEDVPAAFMRAYAVALQPPAGPVFLSIPLDDWDKPALGPAVVRTVSQRVQPRRRAPARVRRAYQPGRATTVGLRSRGRSNRRVGCRHGIRGETARTVYGSPLSDRVSFPENHPLYQGPLPMTIAGAVRIARYDLVDRDRGTGVPLLPLSSPASIVPEGTELLQITADPAPRRGGAGR